MKKNIVAIIGHPNVGKSTLFNKIAGGKIAIIEDIAGVTRDRLYQDVSWNNKNFTIIDTGGIEDEKENFQKEIRIQAEFAISEASIILFVVDGAQSVPHQKTDVIKDNIDFLTFSAHKMLGPTGVGVLYAKKEYLEAMRPIEYGGGMNQSFDSDGNMEFKTVPTRLEAGTPPIAEVIGLGAAIDYLTKIGMDNIEKYERELKEYLIKRLQEIDKVILYNTTSKGGITAFNLEGIFSQDTALYLDHYNICVRAGNHCAKVLKEEINIKNTCRISLYFYNTKEEIDKLIDALKNSEDLYKIVL